MPDLNSDGQIKPKNNTHHKAWKKLMCHFYLKYKIWTQIVLFHHIKDWPQVKNGFVGSCETLFPTYLFFFFLRKWLGKYSRSFWIRQDLLKGVQKWIVCDLGPLFTYTNILGVEDPYKDDFKKCACENLKLECKLSILHHFLDILVFWGSLKFVKSRLPNLMYLFVCNCILRYEMKVETQLCLRQLS